MGKKHFNSRYWRHVMDRHRLSLVLSCLLSLASTYTAFTSRTALVYIKHGRQCGLQAVKADQIPSGIQQKGGHDQGEYRGHEEVSSKQQRHEEDD